MGRPMAAARSMETHLALEAEIDALRAQLGTQVLLHVAVEAAQQARAVVHDLDVGAQPVEDAGHLDRDVAAADDEHAARQRGQVKDVVGDEDELGAREGRPARRAAHRDQDVAGGDGAAFAAGQRDLDLVAARSRARGRAGW